MPRRRAIEQHADRGGLEAVAERVGVAVGEDREAVAEVPAEVVVEQADGLRRSCRGRRRGTSGVGVEREPIDDPLFAERAALGLQAVAHADAHGRQVVGDFGRRRRDPVLHAGAEGVEPRIELRIDERRRAGDVVRAGQLAAERREEQPAAEFFDRVVVELVVERELGRGPALASAYESSASNTTLCARPLRLNSGSRIVGSAYQNGMLARTPAWT